MVERCCTYTIHRIEVSSLERWPVKLLQTILPRHMSIIFEINTKLMSASCAVDLSAPLRSNGGRLCFSSVYFYLFLFTVHAQKLLDRFSQIFQELYILV